MAFPSAVSVGGLSKSEGGLTKREYIAALILPHLQPKASYTLMAEEAVRMAKALEIALNKEAVK